MKMKIMTLGIAACATVANAGAFFSEVEDNNSIAMANDIGSFDTPGGSVAVDGTITRSDVDWFSFTLDNTASLSFFAAFSVGNGDGIMQLVTDTGDVIAFDDDSGVGLMPAIQVENLAAGTYYLAFGGFGDVDSTSVDTDELADGLSHTEDFGYKLSIGFSIVPAPGALALFGMGGIVMTRRRR